LLHPVALWGISVSLSETFKTPPLPCCGSRQGRGLEVALYLICDEQKVWAIFFYFNPFALRALPLYSLTETQGERRVTSIISTEGLFKTSPRLHAPQLSPIFCCAKTPRHAAGHRGGG